MAENEAVVPRDPNTTLDKRKPFKWTPERKKFVDVWISTHSAAEAYLISHGRTNQHGEELSHWALAKRGQRLLDHKSIQQEISSREAPFWRMFPLTVDGILEETTIIAFANMGNYFDFTGTELKFKMPSKIPRWAQAAIQQVSCKTRRRKVPTGEIDEDGKPVKVDEVTQEVSLKLYQKSAALETLAKNFGVTDPKNVANEILRALPADLRSQVASFILQAIDSGRIPGTSRPRGK